MKFHLEIEWISELNVSSNLMRFRSFQSSVFSTLSLKLLPSTYDADDIVDDVYDFRRSTLQEGVANDDDVASYVAASRPETECQGQILQKKIRNN